MNTLLDAYTLRARVYPGLLVLTPVLVTCLGVFPTAFSGVSVLVPIFTAFGALYLLSHVVRQQGKAIEPELWRRWGGKPTTVALRWRSQKTTGHRDLIRSRLAVCVPDVRLPSNEEERADPVGADRSYEAAVSSLRELTRNSERFPIVFSENVSYGFRRNTLALRPLGLVLVIGALVIVAVQLPERWPPTQDDAMFWVAVVTDLAFLMYWLAIVNADWVREAANAYASALFSAAAVLSPASH